MNRNKGITLVSLIITIILLLLLAGITLVELSKSELLKKANDTKNKVQNAEKTQNEILSEYQTEINEIGKNISGKEIFINIDTNITNPKGAIPNQINIIEKDKKKGIVIKDKNNNEWTWIEVPKTIFTKAKSDDDYNNIKEDLISYTTYYKTNRNGSDWSDQWYKECGIIDETEYTKMYNKMLKSIYTNGGFWISKYEIGDKTATQNNIIRTEGMLGTPVSQEDQIPYNYVTCSEAQGLASKMTPEESKTSSLLFGIQWDLVCKYLEEKDGLNKVDIAEDSTQWGNYSNKMLKITSTKAKQLNSEWSAITGTKTASSILLTTGASKETNKMNICDFAGNLWEWTLEKSNYPYTFRGGSYCFNGNAYSANERNYHGTSQNSFSDVGFRTTFY